MSNRTHMLSMDTGEAQNLAKKMLTEERYFHTKCVADAAEMLARRFGGDEVRAVLAAWLHDILKEQPADSLLQRMQGSAIINFTSIEAFPALWHAYAGAAFARHELGLDEEVASAIMYHTTGCAEMSLLEKIVFLADYISDDRKFSNVEPVRERAKYSLDGACLEALRNSIVHLCRMGKRIHINTIQAFNTLIDCGATLK